VRNGIFTAMPYPVDRAFRVFLPNSKGGLPASEVTIPQMLKGAGYRSSLVRNGQMDMDGWMDGWTDRWMDE
jgi:arylsulfatase A-like enzyme